MIIKGSDANKYSRNPEAFVSLLNAMRVITSAITKGAMQCSYSLVGMDEEEIAQLAEWLREKNYDLGRDCEELQISWGNK